MVALHGIHDPPVVTRLLMASQEWCSCFFSALVCWQNRRYRADQRYVQTGRYEEDTDSTACGVARD